MTKSGILNAIGEISETERDLLLQDIRDTYMPLTPVNVNIHSLLGEKGVVEIWSDNPVNVAIINTDPKEDEPVYVEPAKVTLNSWAIISQRNVYTHWRQSIHEAGIRVGTIVETITPVERYPHFICKAGKRGMVTDATNDLIVVWMFDDLPGAEEWDNEIQIANFTVNDYDTVGCFFSEFKIIGPPSCDRCNQGITGDVLRCTPDCRKLFCSEKCLEAHQRGE